MGIMNLSKQEVAKSVKDGKITVCVIGLGRVGLPTAAVFAEVGAQVIGADINPDVVQLVKAGRCQFEDEPGLSELVESVVKNRKLRVTINVSSAVKEADVVVLCVPTPVNESKVPDYSSVEVACHDIAKTLRKECLVIVESTVGPGTVENLVIPLLEGGTGMRAGVDFGVASCPERGDPGKILQNLRVVPRIIGGIDAKSAEVAAALYEAVLDVKIVKVSILRRRMR